MKDKVIYLDFDGVINDNKTPSVQLTTKWGQENYHTGLCPTLVERVNQIHDATGAVVWIHSSWREAYTLETLTEVLQWSNLRAPVKGVVGMNRLSLKMSYHGDGRGTDIRQHVESYGIEKYVILDDMGKSTFEREDHPFHVKTNPKIGIQDSDVQRSIEILNR